MAAVGKKRAESGAETTMNPFEPEISDEVAAKLKRCSMDILRVELANGASRLMPLAPLRAQIWDLFVG